MYNLFSVKWVCSFGFGSSKCRMWRWQDILWKTWFPVLSPISYWRAPSIEFSRRWNLFGLRSIHLGKVFQCRYGAVHYAWTMMLSRLFWAIIFARDTAAHTGHAYAINGHIIDVEVGSEHSICRVELWLVKWLSDFILA